MYTAWLGSEEVKDRAIAVMKLHKELNMVVQRRTWQHDKGSHFGCLTHSWKNNHEKSERFTGFPQHVCYWLEEISDGLPTADYREWIVDSLSAIPVGVDTKLAYHSFCAYVLGPESPSADGNSDERVASEVAAIRDLHLRAASGEVIADECWTAARAAARAAYLPIAINRTRHFDVRRAIAAWCVSAALDSAWTRPTVSFRAAMAFVYAALAAGAINGESATAEYDCWKTFADRSIEILSACPVVECEPCYARIEATLRHYDQIELSIR